MKNLVIYGSGGFAREVHQIIEDINAVSPSINFLGFLNDDEASHHEKIHGCEILGGMDWLARCDPDVAVVVAVGNTSGRRQLVERIKKNTSADFATLIHPRAWVGNRVSIGAGSIICAGTLITTDICIGSHVIVNIGSTIGHDTTIGDYVTIAPTVNVSGTVHAGEGCDLGTGSTIIERKVIGAWSIVGAGAVVVKNVEPNVTVVGAPAQTIKTRAAGWHLG